VLRCDLPGGLGEVQRDAIVGLDHEKVTKPGWRRQAGNPGQERRRPLLVTARDDGVVQLHAHAVIVPSQQASERSHGQGSRFPAPTARTVMPLLVRGPGPAILPMSGRAWWRAWCPVHERSPGWLTWRGGCFQNRSVNGGIPRCRRRCCCRHLSRIAAAGCMPSLSAAATGLNRGEG
jgi:hypothetical protein